MPTARNKQIIPGQPGFYHCISRCVRRAWLCGTDPLSGRNYDHRRDWIIERLNTLSTCFAIDVYAYAVMSNHTHIVLFVDPERVEAFSEDDVIRRYRTLWHWRHPDTPLKLPNAVSTEQLSHWRERLGSVSWFMRALKEPLSRIANAEDGCKGAFWERRFTSTPLLDDSAVTSCMNYVDLNPIKAGVTTTLEDSDFTSIQARLLALRAEDTESARTAPLRPIMGDAKTNTSADDMSRVGLSVSAYIDLVAVTAHGLVHDESAIAHPALDRLGLSGEGWMTMATDFLTYFRSAAGSNAAFEAFMERTGRTRRQDRRGRALLYLS